VEKLFDSQQTLALFLIFFVPGFISLKIYDVFIPTERRDFSKSLFDAVAYSALNLVGLFWLITLMRSGRMPGWLWYFSLLFVCVIAPALWPILLFKLRHHHLIAPHIPGPVSRVWDCLFTQKKEYWVIVHLKDQRRIGGVFSTRSFASSSPAPPEIYLEEVWELNEAGVFTKPVESSAGILILGEDILALEFFSYDQPRKETEGEIVYAE
jgi:hypothetical protein